MEPEGTLRTRLLRPGARVHGCTGASLHPFTYSWASAAPMPATLTPTRPSGASGTTMACRPNTLFTTEAMYLVVLRCTA